MQDDRMLCGNCPDDLELRRWIESDGVAAVCSFCNADSLRTLPLADVAEKIDEAIRSYYRPGPQEAHFTPESDNPVYEQAGETADEVIQALTGVEPDIAEAIMDLLADEEAHDVNDGGEAYFDGEVRLASVGDSSYDWMERWSSFEERLRHEARFFDPDAKAFLKEVLGELETQTLFAYVARFGWAAPSN